MKFYNTKDKNQCVDFKQALFNAQPIGGGLYMPEKIDLLDQNIIQNIDQYTFQEIAFHVASNFLTNIASNKIWEIVNDAISFKAPLIELSENLYSLELWHGPSLAFKDFGARFMARTMSYFLENQDTKLDILVATSGDTGGAVAAGFHLTNNINVTILYPKGKVSPFQEKQICGWGDNITAIEVDGTFDDCQSLVKQAFVDPELTDKLNLGSANSINIARLIPQSFYYFEAYKQLKNKKLDTIFSIPSGNFGNLTAGLMAKRMGLPNCKFIAATNINKIVPDYISTGVYTPLPSKATISNAMDVGNPSNFQRIQDLYGSTWNKIKEDIKGYYLTDTQTKDAIDTAYTNYQYLCDPHGAIAFKACLQEDININRVFLETAHPIKFTSTVSDALPQIQLKEENYIDKNLNVKPNFMMDKSYQTFKSYLIDK